MQGLTQDVATAVMLVMLAAAAYTDWKTGFIPNRVVVGGAFGGVLAHCAVWWTSGAGAALIVAQAAALGLVLCVLVPAVLWGLGGLGGGDLKLFAAIGLCAGPMTGLDIQLAAYLLAMLFMPFYLAKQGRLAASLRLTTTVLKRWLTPRRRREPLPAEAQSQLRFAPCIFVAALAVICVQRLGGY